MPAHALDQDLAPKTDLPPRGVALFSALMTVGIVASLLATFYTQLHILLAPLQSTELQRQAFFYQMTLEKMAERLLEYTRTKDTIDSPMALWGRALVLPIDARSVVQVQMEDANRYLNLNHLARYRERVSSSTRPFALGTANTLREILYQLSMNADPLLATLTDWLDNDNRIIQLKSGSGAELEYYRNLTPSYRSDSTIARHIDTLALVSGFNDEYGLGQTPFDKLKDWVVFSPLQSPINVNTLSCKSPLWKAWTKGAPFSDLCIKLPQSFDPKKVLSLPEAIKISATPSGVNFYDKVDAFYQKLQQRLNINNDEMEDFLPKKMFGVTSNVFILRSTFYINHCKIKIESWIEAPRNLPGGVIDRAMLGSKCSGSIKPPAANLKDNAEALESLGLEPSKEGPL